MQWWSDILGWFQTVDGRAALFGGIIPFVAILVAGIVAAGIGRNSTRRVLTLADRETRISAVATMIGAARRAATWNTLSLSEQQHADHVASEADVRVRLLAVPGSGLAADWAAHELAAMKRNSVSFSLQAEQSMIEFRDRMVMWQARPGRAKKLFKNDVDLWAYEDSQSSNIVGQQHAWVAAQGTTSPAPASAPSWKAADGVVSLSTPSTTSGRAPGASTAGPSTTGPSTAGPSTTGAPVAVAELTTATSETDHLPDETPELVEPRA